MVKFGISEKSTKFEKTFIVLVKKWTKIFQNKCDQVILYKLYASDGGSNPITEIQFVANVLRDNRGIVIFDL